MALARNQQRVLSYLTTIESETAGIDVADGIDELGRSSVYAALAALQRDGMIAARWDHSASHPRRMVKISGAGRQALVEEWRRRPAIDPGELAETGGAS
jgi:DNA-binding PadR family transcriptional regulator